MGPSYTRRQGEASEESIPGTEDSSDVSEENRRKPKLIVIAANCEPSVSEGEKFGHVQRSRCTIACRFHGSCWECMRVVVMVTLLLRMRPN